MLHTESTIKAWDVSSFALTVWEWQWYVLWERKKLRTMCSRVSSAQMYSERALGVIGAKQERR